MRQRANSYHLPHASRSGWGSVGAGAGVIKVAATVLAAAIAVGIGIGIGASIGMPASDAVVVVVVGGVPPLTRVRTEYPRTLPRLPVTVRFGPRRERCVPANSAANLNQ